METRGADMLSGNKLKILSILSKGDFLESRKKTGLVRYPVVPPTNWVTLSMSSHLSFSSPGIWVNNTVVRGLL